MKRILLQGDSITDCGRKRDRFDDPGAGRMKIGFGTVCFRRYELERCLAAMREVGFEYFETQATVPFCNHVDVFQDDPEHLVRLKKKYGYKEITALWAKSGNLLSDADFPTTVGVVLEWAKAAGIPIVHIGDGNLPAGMSQEEGVKRIADRLAAACEKASAAGVKLAIEPHGHFSLTEKGLKMLMSCGPADVLGINYDCANVFRAGYVETTPEGPIWRRLNTEENEVSVLDGVKERVIHFHIKDTDLNGNCVPLGEGLVQAKECVQLMKTYGYQGALSWETEGNDDFERALENGKKAFAFMNECLK